MCQLRAQSTDEGARRCLGCGKDGHARKADCVEERRRDNDAAALGDDRSRLLNCEKRSGEVEGEVFCHVFLRHSRKRSDCGTASVGKHYINVAELLARYL